MDQKRCGVSFFSGPCHSPQRARRIVHVIFGSKIHWQASYGLLVRTITALRPLTGVCHHRFFPDRLA